jgi:hypothetical protein
MVGHAKGTLPKDGQFSTKMKFSDRQGPAHGAAQCICNHLRNNNVLTRNFKKAAAVGCCLLLALTLGSRPDECAAATIIGPSATLSSLLVPETTLVVGDKTFSNFGYLFGGDMPPPTSVNVTGIIDNDGNYGIRFQGAFMDLPSTLGGSDALITYDVEAGENFLISDAHVQGNPNVLGPIGSMSVTETFLPLGAGGEYTMEIYDDENSNSAQLVDVTFFTPPTKKLNVQKDILGLALPGGGSATMSMVDQTFSQIQIPEPATPMLLFGTALAIGSRRRRRR